jgi:hypothetical protein
MAHLSRLALFSATAIIVGGVSLGSLTGKIIDAGDGVLMVAAKGTVAPATSSADFPICHTPATPGPTNTLLRLAQTRTEVWLAGVLRNHVSGASGAAREPTF